MTCPGTVVGNTFIIVFLVENQYLFKPMDSFLENLSSLETCYSSTTLSQLLACFLTGDSTISTRSGVITILFTFCMYCFLLLSPQ